MSIDLIEGLSISRNKKRTCGFVCKTKSRTYKSSCQFHVCNLIRKNRRSFVNSHRRRISHFCCGLYFYLIKHKRRDSADFACLAIEIHDITGFNLCFSINEHVHSTICNHESSGRDSRDSSTEHLSPGSRIKISYLGNTNFWRTKIGIAILINGSGYLITTLVHNRNETLTGSIHHSAGIVVLYSDIDIHCIGTGHRIHGYPWLVHVYHPIRIRSYPERL